MEAGYNGTIEGATECREYLPSRAEIAEACLRIQSGWDEATRLQRARNAMFALSLDVDEVERGQQAERMARAEAQAAKNEKPKEPGYVVVSRPAVEPTLSAAALDVWAG